MRKNDHIVATADAGLAGGECLNCKARLSFGLPCTVDEWVAAMRAFIDRHRNCKPPKEKDDQGKVLLD
jgi:hypothetical protein